MRRLHFLPLALLALAAVAYLGLAQDPPVAGIPTPKHNPQSHALMALGFLKDRNKHRSFRAGCECNIRFISWLGVPDEQLPKFKRVANVWWNMMSFERAVTIPKDVPGSDGRLQWFDLSSFRWNSEAFQAVAERDRTFREPWVDCKIGEELRKLIHVTPKNCVTVHGYKLVPIEAVVWAPQLFRDTIETDRSPSYYDLLFARQRFGDYGSASILEQHTLRLKESFAPNPGLGKEAQLRFAVSADALITVGGERIHSLTVTTPPLKVDGVYDVVVRVANLEASSAVTVKPGQITTVTVLEPDGDSKQRRYGFVNADFPRTDKEFDSAFGTDVAQNFQRDQAVDLEYGAVVEGGRDNPRGGSIVALNNRLLVDEPGPLHAMRTFDVVETSGDKDFLENSPKLPFKFRQKNIAFDASEMLSYLPNGGQAGFLTDGQGKRAELAAQKVADGRGASPKRLSPGVRNPGDCVVCHAASGGYIVPVNLIKSVIEGGVDFHFKDPADETRFRGFYLGWEKRIKTWTDPYHDLVAECTKEPLPTAAEWEAAAKADDPQWLVDVFNRSQQAKRGKGWTSAQWAKEFEAMREYYDGPQSTKVLAAELGVPTEVMKRLAAYPVFREAEYRLPVRNTVRLSALVRDLPTPRAVFDRDLYPILGLLLYEQRETPKGRRP